MIFLLLGLGGISQLVPLPLADYFRLFGWDGVVIVIFLLLRYAFIILSGDILSAKEISYEYWSFTVERACSPYLLYLL